MLRSIATVSLGGSLADKIRAIAAAGFQGVEIFDQDLLNFSGTPATLRQLAADLGLQITLFQPLRDVEGNPRKDFAGSIERAKRKIALMHELGCDRLLLCSNTRADSCANPDRQCEDLRILATLAEQEQIVIGYEALAWGHHVQRWRQAWARVRQVDSPAMGIVLDSFHILSLGDTLDGLEDVPLEKLTFVQLADAPKMEMEVQQWSRHFRCFPGKGQLPVVMLAQDIQRRGYRGPWSLEIFNDSYQAAPMADIAREGNNSLLWLEKQLKE